MEQTGDVVMTCYILDWNQTTYLRNSNLTYEDWGYISPMVMEYLCPKAISVLGLGAISAAVMSSADSIVLAAGSVVTINIYKNCFRQKKVLLVQW